MSTLETEMKGLKSRYSQHLTRDEALDLALQAADLHMKFLRIAKEGPEKKALSQRCSSILDEAEKIKSEDVWSFDSDSLIGFETLQPERSSLSSNLLVDPPNSSNIRGLTTQTVPMVLRSSSPARSTSTTDSRISAGRNGTTNRSSALLKSNRIIPKKEQILLWQASELHGSKFPPWENPPSNNEFERVHGELLFT